MASKYGFMTEEEVKRAMEQEKGTLDESHKKECERLDLIVTEILEDFATACGFYKGALVRGDGSWSVMQGENSLVTVALDHPGQSEDFSLSITDETLLRSKTPHNPQSKKAGRSPYQGHRSQSNPEPALLRA